MSATLSELERLPALVRELAARVAELEAKASENTADVLLDAKAAAEMLGMSPAAVRQAAYRGSIPCVKVGRRLRFRRSQLAALH
jgi:excisionase family DNA binding protein